MTTPEPGTGFVKGGGQSPRDCHHCRFMSGSVCVEPQMVKLNRTQRRDAEGFPYVARHDVCRYFEEAAVKGKDVAAGDCPRCKGTGKIMVKGMEQPTTCPACKGSGKRATAKDAKEATGKVVAVGGEWFYRKPNDALRYGPYKSASEAAEAARRAGVAVDSRRGAKDASREEPHPFTPKLKKPGVCRLCGGPKALPCHQGKPSYATRQEPAKDRRAAAHRALDRILDRAKDADAHVGMLSSNPEKAKALKARLERQGFQYRFPAEPPKADMVRHAFVKRGVTPDDNEWKILNERANGYHNITEVK